MIVIKYPDFACILFSPVYYDQRCSLKNDF